MPDPLPARGLMPDEAFGLVYPRPNCLIPGARPGTSPAHRLHIQLTMPNFIKAAALISFLVPALSFADVAKKDEGKMAPPAATTETKTETKTTDKAPAKTATTTKTTTKTPDKTPTKTTAKQVVSAQDER